MEEDVKDPFAGSRVGLDSRRVEDFGSEVAAEETPGGAIGRGGDVVLVAVDDLIGGEGDGAIGEDGAGLD